MYKFTKFAAAAFIAGGLVAGVTGHAQTTLTSNPGDLILAFEIPDQNGSATGGQLNLEVDLGSIASLDSLSNGGIVTLGNFLSLSDLTSTYGSGWNTSNSGNSVVWTVFGASGSTNEVWTTDSVNPYSDTGAHLGATNDAMSSIYTDLSSVTTTANSNYAYVANSSSDPNSFTQDIGGSDWGDYNGDVPGNVLKLTTSTTPIDLYDLQPQSSKSAAPAAGAFALASNGTLYFTDAVPEPSTWACMIAGVVCLIGFGWRRSRA
jgi:hypothetical protein